jgi:diamine N-acetyltransferase
MFTLKPATINDIPVLRDIAYKTWFATYKDILSQEQANYMFEWMYSESSLLEQMTHKGHHFFLLFVGDVPRGYVSYSKEQEGLYHLHKIYVLPQTQGSGLGKSLLNFVFDQAKAASGDSPCAVELNVNRYNKAVRFYQKMGMYIHDEGDFDIGHGYLMTDYIMRKDL